MKNALGLNVLGVFLLFASGCGQIQGRVAAREGSEKYEERKYAEAITSFEEAKKYLPNSKTIKRNLGYSYLAASREESSGENKEEYGNKAIKILKALLDESPRDNELAAILLDAWEFSNRLGEAVEFFKSRLAADPKDIEALRGLGVVERKRGNYIGALDVYEKRMRLSADDDGVYELIAETTWQWLRAGGPDDLGEALTLATKGVDAAAEGSKRRPKNRNILVFQRLLLYEQQFLQIQVCAVDAGGDKSQACFDDIINREDKIKCVGKVAKTNDSLRKCFNDAIEETEKIVNEVSQKINDLYKAEAKGNGSDTDKR